MRLSILSALWVLFASLPNSVMAETLKSSETNADFLAFSDLLRSSWANIEVHERIDGFQLRKRIEEQLRAFGEAPPLTDQDFYLALRRFALSLHDGHLYVVLPNAKWQALESGLGISPAREGLLLTSCEPQCSEVALPALVQKIDGVASQAWIRKRSQFAPGSTIFGRTYHVVRGLSSFEGLASEPNGPPQEMTLLTRDGKHRKLRISWRPRPQVPPTTPKEPDCIHSSFVGETLILSVPTFFCHIDGEDDPAQWDRRFVEQMNKALDVDRPFHQILVDLRGNGGGMPGHAVPLAAHFLSNKAVYYRSRLRGAKDLKFWDTFADPAEVAPGRWEEEIKTKPLWLLTDGGCFSQCSLFALALKEAGRAKVIGQAIDSGAGGGSSELWVAPSGRWKANVPPWETLGADGTFIEGHSLQLDIPTLPRWSDFSGSNDPTLENAEHRIREL